MRVIHVGRDKEENRVYDCVKEITILKGAMVLGFPDGDGLAEEKEILDVQSSLLIKVEHDG